MAGIVTRNSSEAGSGTSVVLPHGLPASSNHRLDISDDPDLDRGADHGNEPLLLAGQPFLLVVDDDEMNRDMLSRRLLKKGYQVVLAVDGQSGVELAQTEAPDLILMDMSLPVLDGWEASRKLKTNPQTRHVPIIALTAHAMAGDRERAIEAGCDDYDTKPIALPRLLGKIEALL